MSIKGIDAQIMIARAPDFVKEANAQLKTGDRMQSFLAEQAKAEAEHDKSSIGRTEQTSGPELHLGEEGGGDNFYSPSGNRKNHEEVDADFSILDAEVGSVGSTIDIKL